MAIGHAERSESVRIRRADDRETDLRLTRPLAAAHPPGAGRYDLDVNIGIPPNPAVHPPIDLPDGGVAQSSFLHGQVYDVVVVGIIGQHH